MKKLILSLLIVGLAGTACSSTQKVEDASADATDSRRTTGSSGTCAPWRSSHTNSGICRRTARICNQY